jgi:hypothetical protein
MHKFWLWIGGSIVLVGCAAGSGKGKSEWLPKDQFNTGPQYDAQKHCTNYRPLCLMNGQARQCEITKEGCEYCTCGPAAPFSSPTLKQEPR